MRIFYVLHVFLLSILLGCSDVLAAHGLSLDGELKYPSGFERFSYTSPQAKKGGRLTLHAIGSFDKMNPFTLKGEEPYGLETFVFETLGVPSLDEPFAEYGLIARDIEVADDGLSVTFTLDPQARFADGTPVSVEDVAFSLKTLKGPDVHPFYPYYYRDIDRSEIVDSLRIRFIFSQKNRELPMIAAQLPVFSERSFVVSESGEAGSHLAPPLGSGPYVVDQVIQGRTITYKRNPAYWAVNHPTRKGMFNYDEITVKYYKDQIVALEAFKAGEFDVMSVNIAKQWARDLEGSRFASGELVKKIFPHKNNAGMQGFLMNTRRPVFKDRRVRQAVGLAFDFEWTNNALFYGQYTRADSFFSNSYLAARGLPTGLELEYLEPYRKSLPPEVFTTPLQPPTTDGQDSIRHNLRQAMRLLNEAGYKVKDGKLVNSEGVQFAFDVLLVSQSFERVMASFVSNLEKLGMKVSYRTIDQTLYTERLKSFDFDMIVTTYGQSQSPGNEQRNFWHSEAADTPGSNNYAGIKSAAVDGLVERIIYATSQGELTAACRALDRVLWYGYYMVPNWYMSGHRLSYHDIFLQPETLPVYYSPIQLIMTWWLKP